MRLDLDFSKDSTEERLEFLEQYIEGKEDKLTDANLEMMANYVLWSIDEPDFEIDSSNSPWKSRESKHISWQALEEQENETGKPAAALISDIVEKQGKRKLEREKVLDKLGKNREHIDKLAQTLFNKPNCRVPIETMTDVFEAIEWHPMTSSWMNLWSEIDETEYKIQRWELNNGKRRPDLPIREELLMRLCYNMIFKAMPLSFSEYLESLNSKAALWDGYKYLKKKRNLVSLRTQQYNLLDSIQGEGIQKHGNVGMYWVENDNGIEAFLPFQNPKLIFEEINDKMFTRQYMDICINALKFSDNHKKSYNIIDLRDGNTIRQLLIMQEKLEDSCYSADIKNREIIVNLLKYLNYYIEKCHFSDDLIDILYMKSHGSPNKKIAEMLKEKYNLTYKENYISTIYSKRIIDAIVKQVEEHYKMIEYIISGKEVFKRCSCCGKLLPRNATYFNKRTSANDGFFNTCKSCKKKERENKRSAND